MRKSRKSKAISWLPIDSRLFIPFLSFGRVKGVARIFLQTEIVLSILVVIGALMVVVMRFVVR